MLADLQHRLGLDNALSRSDHPRNGLGPGAQQEVVEVLALLGWQGDGDVETLRAQAPGGRVCCAHPGPGDIMIGEDDNAPDGGRQIDLLKARGRERGPDRQIGARCQRREPGLDAFRQRQPVAVTEVCKPHCTTGDAAEHLLRLVDGRLARAAVEGGVEPGAVQADNRSVSIANLRDECWVAGLRLPVRQVGMEKEVALRRNVEAPASEVVRGGRAFDRPCSRKNVCDLERRVPLRGGGCRRRAPLGCARCDAGDFGGLDDERPAVDSGRLLDSADRPAALIAVEVDPVAGMRPAQGDDAGARIARRVAPDVREAPLVARAPPVREQSRHPRLSGLAQSLDDQVEVVPRCIAADRLDVVEVKQGSPGPSRPA